MPPAAGQTSLQTVLAGLSSGSSADRVIGTKQSGPIGIESVIEYRSKTPVYLNVVEWNDTFIIITINGLDSADLRMSALQNPGEHGETPNDALWGGRTVILVGKMYASTIWKLRDMQQGLRGSFMDISNEYPLIFHGLAPEDDLMLMCKLGDKINIPDQQTTKNDFQRDFQITLRASNPRFLSVVRQQEATATLSNVTYFTTDNLPIIEDFTAASGLSSGYAETGHGYSPGSDFLIERAYLRNMIINPRGDSFTPLFGINSGYDWEVGTRGVENLSVLPTGGITVPNTGVGGPAVLLTSVSGHVASNIEFFSHAAAYGPPVVGGDKVRITGWIYFEASTLSPDTSVGVALRWWTYPEEGSISQVVAPIPLTDGGFVVKPTSTPWVANRWYRVDTTITAPVQAGVNAFPAALFYVANILNPNNQIGSFSMRVAEPMMDLDRDPTRGVLYGDGTYPGWIYEGQPKYSIARRRMTFANMLSNTRAYISERASDVDASGVIALDRIQDSTPAKMNNFVGHNTWWRLVSNGSGMPGQAVAVPPSGALKKPMVLMFEQVKVATLTTYNFSFYVRAQVTGRRIYVMASFLTPGTNPSIPLATFIPVQTHGSDGKDAPNEWRRFWVDIPVPAGTVNMVPMVLFTMEDATPIPSTEWHEVSAAMLYMGSGPRAYRDASGIVAGRKLPEYSWAGTPNDSPTLGPWGFRNLLSDSNSNKADTSAMVSVSSTLAKVATGGVVDNTKFIRATHDGSSAIEMGLSSQASVSERTAYAVSTYVRLAPGMTGQRRVMLDVWWYQDTVSVTTQLASNVPSYFTITADEWSELKLENIIPPDKASIAVVRVLLCDSRVSDRLDVDRMMMTNRPVSEGWFGTASEWAYPADSSNLHGEALRPNYSAYLTPRKFRECQQQVRVTLPAVNTGDDTVHLAVAYIDDDNQIYVTMESPNLMTICRRDGGIYTKLTAVALTTQIDGYAYYLRARMSDGIVFAEADNEDMDSPSPYGTAMIQSKYTLTDTEVVKYQDTLLPMRFGVQAMGGNWIVDEWRYYDLTQPEGWNMHRGKGTVSVKGSKLIPLDKSEKMMTRAGFTYRVADARISVKQRYENQPTETQGSYDGGVAAKVLDEDNFIAATIMGKDSGDAGLTSMNLYKYDNGVRSSLRTSELGSMPVATDNWVRLVMVGNSITVERWNTDPTLGGSPADSIVKVLSGADATKFGAGVKGEFGIYWPNPQPLRSSMDDFSFALASFDDIALTLKNKGNFEAQTTIYLTGPMTNPRVINEANNTAFRITATIPAEETWVVENNGPSKRLYRRSDGANRFQYLDATSMWVTLVPDSVPNNIRFTATALVAGWDMQVSFRHTYM